MDSKSNAWRAWVRKPVHPGSKAGIAILVVVGLSHLFSHYGGDNEFALLMCPLVPLFCPAAFLSGGIRNPADGTGYIAGIILNSYLLGYLSWWLVFKASGRVWGWFWRPSD
jgi:hypothetical protein